MTNKRIFFLTIDNNEVSGGRRVIYQLVDILAKHGYQAFVLHQKRNFRYTWFKNVTPVCYTYQIKKNRRRTGFPSFFRFALRLANDWIEAPSQATSKVAITKDDILVLPATRITFCHEIVSGIPIISLSQGPYLLFQSGGLADKRSAIYYPDIKARITMSELNYAMHCLVFPQDTVWNVPVCIDPNLYSYSKNKKKQIAYMPRRLPKDSTALINLLTLRGNLHDFDFVPIDGMSQSQSACVLQESLMFLSFSHREGLGLPPAEAMACGCIVVGYSGNGGEEFFDDDIAYKISDGDLISYVKRVEAVIQEYDTNPERLNAMRKLASERILTKYTREKTEADFLHAWQQIMTKLG